VTAASSAVYANATAESRPIETKPGRIGAAFSSYGGGCRHATSVSEAPRGR
jgi:hypothetical protein